MSTRKREIGIRPDIVERIIGHHIDGGIIGVYSSYNWLPEMDGLKRESAEAIRKADRAIDNVFIERLWRSIKYEYIYYRPPVDGLELYQGLQDWFHKYNTNRRHTAINDEFPETVYRLHKPQAPEAAKRRPKERRTWKQGRHFKEQGNDSQEDDIAFETSSQIA